MPDTPALSVVIAAYDEESRLAASLQAIRASAERRGQRWQVIVVDDGSRDRTADVAREFDGGAALDIEVMGHPRNRGKGFCARRGMVVAVGDRILLTDADLSTPIDELDKLLPWFDSGFDIVIGSRDLPESQLDPPQPFYRRAMGVMFRTFRRALLLPHLRDTQCGFKMYRREVAHELFALLETERFGFDCEILGLADLFGYAVKEQAVTWQNDRDSRVRPIADSARMALDLFLTRRRLRQLGEDLMRRR
jgi:dolichyl-phosphate beta-glucosyltransferase